MPPRDFIWPLAQGEGDLLIQSTATHCQGINSATSVSAGVLFQHLLLCDSLEMTNFVLLVAERESSL